MNTVTGLAIYHPHRLDPDEFLARFVARIDLADFLLDKLRKVPPDGVAEHQLFVGQRGMGKTSLLRRLAIGVSQDADLAERYIPLTFREEQYNVRSLARLWRNCEESLAEWCESQGKSDIAADIDRRLSQPVWHDPRAAADAFLATAKSLGGRPILFIDNLDLILDALPPDEHWVLRQTLQAPGGPILYAAATQLIRQSGDRGGAFYEFFYPHLLQPLSEDELMRCLRKLADVRGQAGAVVHDILAREPERLRTLHKLTGGNPRVLALVYQLLERAESDSVFSDLEVLLDQLTPFYKARVEEYRSELQRAIIDAVALHWDPITSHDLAKATEVEITTISSQLTRFKNDGLIEEVPTSGARSGYQLAERFFNIWYLMRHGTRRTRQKMYWLTAFLKNFYAPDELKRMRSEAVIVGQSRPHPLYREALFAAVESPPSVVQLNFSDEAKVERTPQEHVARSEEEIAVYDDVVARFEAASEPALREQVAQALVDKGLRLGALGRSDEAIAVFDDVVARFEAASEPALREQVARALVSKGITFGELGRSEGEIAVFDNVVARFEAASEPALHEQVAGALINKGNRLCAAGRNEDALAAYRRAIEIQPDHTGASIALGNLLADQFGQLQEAEVAYRNAMLSVSDELVAKANLGWLLMRTGRIADAKTLRATLNALDAVGLALFDAALEITVDNLGSATEYLTAALNEDSQALLTTFFDDLLRLLRLVKAHAYGEKLIEWFRETRYSERYAPLYAAFVAYVRGKQSLLDISPEVRATAEPIYRWLVGHEATQHPSEERTRKSKRRRGPPKR
jgi:tetratricopeptide (TPR) repeat protein